MLNAETQILACIPEQTVLKTKP